MSYLDTLLVQCEDFQTKLGNVWAKDASLVRDPIPFLEYLRSDDNMNGIDVAVNPGEGKTMNVNLTYFQRIPESQVVAASERGCATETKRGNCVKQYSIDTTALLNSSEVIEAKDLERFCQNNDEYIVGVIMRHLNAIDRKVATQTATQAAALLGGYSADAVAAYSITGDDLVLQTKDSGGQYLPGAIEKLDQAALMSSYSGFISFGGNAMSEYLRLTLSGCCSNSGLDVLELYRQYGYAFAYDRRLATALGNVLTKNMIMEPGSLQLLNYTQTPWKDNISIEMKSGYEAIQLTTPAGVDVDVYIKDDCPGKISINVFANTKLVGLPDDLFPTGDNFDGVNYTGLYTVTNP
jgi:hypothetical protein